MVILARDYMSQELPTPIFIDQIEHILLFSCCKNENIFLFCKQKSTIPRFLSIKSGINQKIQVSQVHLFEVNEVIEIIASLEVNNVTSFIFEVNEVIEVNASLEVNDIT